MEYFHPDPNYVLAFTGGAGYLLLATGLYMVEYVSLSTLALALTSIWFHTQRTWASFLADQLAIGVWVVTMVRHTYTVGWIPFATAILCCLYSGVVFFCGQKMNRCAYDRRRSVATLFHASIHFASILVVAIFGLNISPKPIQ